MVGWRHCGGVTWRGQQRIHIICHLEPADYFFFPQGLVLLFKFLLFFLDCWLEPLFLLLLAESLAGPAAACWALAFWALAFGEAFLLGRF
jgi:hypothetical protein